MKEFMRVFEKQMIKAYVDEYGKDAWESKSDEEQSELLHELITSFLTVAKNR
jgi:hypothetical protein